MVFAPMAFCVSGLSINTWFYIGKMDIVAVGEFCPSFSLVFRDDEQPDSRASLFQPLTCVRIIDDTPGNIKGNPRPVVIRVTFPIGRRNDKMLAEFLIAKVIQDAQFHMRIFRKAAYISALVCEFIAIRDGQPQPVVRALLLPPLPPMSPILS